MTKATRYFIPEQAIEIETEIKRSRFIAHIAHCSDTEAALQIIEQARQSYPDARHHCWAYIACPPLSSTAVRFSDGGEPSGTAGKPILNVLQHSHYGEIICVVSRYFGGTKLGAGGLVRAYSNSTLAALEQLTVREIVELQSLQIDFAFPFESSIRRYLESIKVNIAQVEYQAQVIFQIQIEQTLIANMQQQVRNICKGQVAFIHHK
jgi:uncharacterized YigZ family protein